MDESKQTAALKKTAERPHRIWYLDLLRILATFAVVVLHVSAQGWYDTDVRSFAWQSLNFWNALSRWGVPVFVMISGALFLDRDIPVKKLLSKYVLRMATAYVFWSAVYAGDSVCRGLPLKDGLYRFITGKYHMWFIVMIAGMYLLLPLLRRIAADPYLLRYFLVLALVFSVLIPQGLELLALRSSRWADALRTVVDHADLFLPMGYTIYFLLGHLLLHGDLRPRTQRVLCWLGLLGAAVTVAANGLAAMRQGTAVGMFYNKSTVNVLFFAAGMFVSFGRIFRQFSPGPRMRRVIAALSRWSFGAYLVHVMVLEKLQLHFGIVPSAHGWKPIVSVPLISLLIFALSLAVSAAIGLIPGLRRYIV